MANDPTSWLARLLRFSLFSAQVLTEHDSWFKTVTGSEPETRMSHKGTSRFEGPFETGKLSLLIQPGRIDWLLSCLDNALEAEELPTIGGFELSLKAFSTVVERWHGLAPAVSRLALGADLVQPVSSLRDAYEMLAKYLKRVRLEPEESSDFIYRINRPAPSTTIDGLRINRLSTWSAIQTSVMSFELPPGRPTLSRVAVTPSGRPAARVELDINTAGDYTGEFGGETIARVFSELASLATQIATGGEP